jgi:hypothetical protein
MGPLSLDTESPAKSVPDKLATTSFNGEDL